MTRLRAGGLPPPPPCGRSPSPAAQGRKMAFGCCSCEQACAGRGRGFWLLGHDPPRFTFFITIGNIASHH